MNTVNFFGHSVSRLIVGDNPFNGHSYIEDKTAGQEMKSWYTSERIKETLREIERCGYNTMLPLADPYILRLLMEHRREGGKLQFIFQPYMPMDQEVSMRQMAELNPLGVYHQGTTTDYLYEQGRCDEIIRQIEQYRRMDIPVGLGTHLPEVIERSEEEGWPVDFYAACMQNARRNRRGEPSGFITGKTKSALVFQPEDRAVMLNTLKNVSKPIIAYKIFAGGQLFLNRSEAEKPAVIKGAYEEVFSALKPGDMAAVGVFQRDENQVRENAELYNEWYQSRL